MDQFNLFEDTPAAADCTPTTSVGHTAQKDTPIGQNPNGIFAFALKEARRMWDGVEHRRRSLEQLERFCRYQDNDELDLSEITPDVVHEFIDHIAQPTIITLKDGKQKKQKGASEGTQNRYTATLSKVMKTAAARQKISKRHRSISTRKILKAVRAITRQKKSATSANSSLIAVINGWPIWSR